PLLSRCREREFVCIHAPVQARESAFMRSGVPGPPGKRNADATTTTSRRIRVISEESSMSDSAIEECFAYPNPGEGQLEVHRIPHDIGSPDSGHECESIQADAPLLQYGFGRHDYGGIERHAAGMVR